MSRFELDLSAVNNDFAPMLWKMISCGGIVIYLQGPVGVGKTSLLRAVLQAAGYMDVVQSPSYGLLNVYDIHPPLVHCDLYRFDRFNVPELLMLEYYQDQGIYMIEWASQAEPNCLPDPHLIIEISFFNKSCDKRNYTLLVQEGHHQQRLRQLSQQLPE